MKKRGQAAIYIAFVAGALLLVACAAVFVPMTVRINTEFFKTGQQLILQSNASIQSIQDSAIKTEITDGFASASEATATNITVGTDIFTYAWVIFLFITALGYFLYSRRLVEFGYGGLI
jgi:predicted PurR-regulated permease PerM